jgi:hypothetical protein
MRPTSIWFTVLFMMLAVGFSVVTFVQQVQIYVLQKDIQRLELPLEDESCWYEAK